LPPSEQLNLLDAIDEAGGFDEWDVFEESPANGVASTRTHTPAPADRAVINVGRAPTHNRVREHDWSEHERRDPGTATTLELARSRGHNARVMARVLADEERLGHIERVGDAWRVAPSFEAEWGQAFRDFTLGSGIEDAA
jgi:hypothetical protein